MADLPTIMEDGVSRQMTQAEYDEWQSLSAGVPAPREPQPPIEQIVTFQQENRIRALEGKKPLTLADFIDQYWTQARI